MHKLLFSLANALNAPDMQLIACANEFHVAADKPLHIAFGDYPYGSFRMPNGQTVFITQRFDRSAADAWSAALANELARGGKGIPIYAGHPDVPELAAKYPDKRAWGWGNRMEIGADGVDLYALWNEDTKNGFAYFSPYWIGPAISQSGSSVTTHMTACKSIGLTNDPNIKEFRLPNESAAAEETTMNELMKFLIALLKIDPNSTEEQVKAAIQKLADDNTSLKGAADAAKSESATAQTAAKTAETALANERNARIGLLLDGALADGRVTPAGKTAWEANLKKDFDAFSVALANEKKQLKTDSVLDPARAKNPASSVQGQILALVNEAKAKGLTHDQAFAQVKAAHQELFALPA